MSRGNPNSAKCKPPGDCLSCPFTDECGKPFCKEELSYTWWQNENELENHPRDILIRIKRNAHAVEFDSYGQTARKEIKRHHRKTKITVNVEVEEC